MPLNRAWKRRVVMGVWMLGLPLVWKGFLRVGPGLPTALNRARNALGMAAEPDRPGPALFRRHAAMLLQAELAFPRGLEGYLPAPEPGTPAHQQLMGLGLWSGTGWTDQALALGVAEGRGLRPRLGKLVLARVGEVSPSRGYNGPELCQVDFFVRWDLGDAPSELIRTAGLVGLRWPEGLSMERPGGEADQQITLERTVLGWRVWRPETLQIPGRPSRGRAWLTFLL